MNGAQRPSRLSELLRVTQPRLGSDRRGYAPADDGFEEMISC